MGEPTKRLQIVGNLGGGSSAAPAEIPYFNLYEIMRDASIPTDGREFNLYELDLTEIVEALKRGPVRLNVGLTSADGVGHTGTVDILTQAYFAYEYANMYGVFSILDMPYQYYLRMDTYSIRARIMPLETVSDKSESESEMLELNLIDLGIEDINYLLDAVPVTGGLMEYAAMMVEKGMARLTYSSGGSTHTAICTCTMVYEAGGDIGVHIQMPITNDVIIENGRLVIKANDLTATMQYVPDIPIIDLAEMGLPPIPLDVTNSGNTVHLTGVDFTKFERALQRGILRVRVAADMSGGAGADVRMITSTVMPLHDERTNTWQISLICVSGGSGSQWVTIRTSVMYYTEDSTIIAHGVAIQQTSLA